MDTKPEQREVLEILEKAKALAIRYKILTGKPLGITGEVAEFEAARLLSSIELTPAREPGHDAVESVSGRNRKLQIKGRCFPLGSSKTQRLGRIDVGKDWDAVLMVLMDEDLKATEIYEVDRNPILRVVRKSASAANRRGALTVAKMKSLGRKRWPL